MPEFKSYNKKLLDRIRRDNLVLGIDCQRKIDVFYPNGYDGSESLLVAEIGLDRASYHKIVSILPEWWTEWGSPGAITLTSEMIEKIRPYMITPPQDFDLELYEYILFVN